MPILLVAIAVGCGAMSIATSARARRATGTFEYHLWWPARIGFALASVACAIAAVIATLRWLSSPG